MSENVSAFAIYNGNRKKNSWNGPGTSKGKAVKNKTGAGTATNKASGGAAKNKTAANKKTTTKTANVVKAKQNSMPHKANGKSTRNDKKFIENLDKHLEELLGDSPTRKPLSKKQLKEKKELEMYLIRQLEMDDSEKIKEDEEEEEDVDSDEYNDESDEEEDDDDENDSDKDVETDSESNEEYTDASLSEYTLNSYADTDSSEGENDSPTAGEAFSLQALAMQTKPGNKRRSTESESASANVPQKLKATTNAMTNANVQPSASRKSMPAQSATNAKDKTANERRSLGNAATTKSTRKVEATTKADIISHMVKLEPMSLSQNVNKINSIEEGLRMLRWMLNPLDANEFFEKYWEKNVCLIKREQRNYYTHLISFQDIDKMLLDHHVEFTKNIDITSYKNGVRETLNPEGRALPPIVWDHYGQGCSLRLLNPQTFLPQIFNMNTTMQEYFHCMVGANVYLTPPNSQGFAPHYDDIEAFVLQVEGRKRWRLYKPRTQAEILPRFSSANFKQNEIGKPILDQVLEPGDLLYFPRGTIHQACTEPGYHSLHITVSVYQKQSYADLFENMLPILLKRAIANNVDLRRGLPLDTFRQAGLAFSNNETKERADLMENVSKLLSKTLEDINLPQLVDGAVDMLAKRFQHDALPPYIMPSERSRTVYGSRSVLNEKGECICDYEFNLRTNIRLSRAHILRVVREENDNLCLYFYGHNSKEYHEFEPNFIEIDSYEAACIEVLLRSYPAYIGVAQLPFPEDNRKIEFAQALWERGLLMLEKPLQ